MVKHPGREHDVERPAERVEIEDIAVKVVDIGDAEFAGLAAGIGEAGAAEVDGRDLRPGQAARDLDRLLARAAAGDEDLRCGQCSRRGVAEVQAKLVDHLREGHAALARPRADPARIGVGLVLASDLFRDLVGDLSEGRDPAAQVGLLFRFGDLHPPDRLGQVVGREPCSECRLAERQVAGQAEQVRHLRGRAPGEVVLHPSGARVERLPLLGGDGVDIVVDEALCRQRGEHRHPGRGFCQGFGMQAEGGAQPAQQPLDIGIGDRAERHRRGEQRHPGQRVERGTDIGTVPERAGSTFENGIGKAQATDRGGKLGRADVVIAQQQIVQQFGQAGCQAHRKGARQEVDDVPADVRMGRREAQRRHEAHKCLGRLAEMLVGDGEVVVGGGAPGLKRDGMAIGA